MSDTLLIEFLKPYAWARFNIWKYSGVEEVLGGGTRSPRGYLWSESSDDDDDDGDNDDATIMMMMMIINIIFVVIGVKAQKWLYTY